jgi:DNA-binding SARP family transcriptional activator
MYLALLDKLMGYCKAHQDYEAGVTYGGRILRYDPARERTHQRLMRLHCLAGDRTAAMRQFERCVEVLDRELGVRPDPTTVALYEQIRANGLPPAGGRHERHAATPEQPERPRATQLLQVLDRLKHIKASLSDIQEQIERDIWVVEGALDDPP